MPSQHLLRGDKRVSVESRRISNALSKSPQRFATVVEKLKDQIATNFNHQLVTNSKLRQISSKIRHSSKFEKSKGSARNKFSSEICSNLKFEKFEKSARH
ncbi:hypothetical protein SLE2022_259900 [Rubroshorea leprosula]